MSLETRSNELDKKLEHNEIDDSISTLVKGAKRQRRAIRLLALSILLDFILTIGLTIFSIKTNEALQLAQNNRQAIVQNCETANDSRKNQRELWRYVTSLTPSQPRNAEQQARVEDFNKFVEKTFAQRDCQAEAEKLAK